jgi:hypothetical protein
LVCEAIGTAATPGLLCQPRVIMNIIGEKQMECKLAGETEVLGENLPRCHFCPSQNPTWPDPSLNPGRRGGKPATNRLSYGAGPPACFTLCCAKSRYNTSCKFFEVPSQGKMSSSYIHGSYHKFLRPSCLCYPRTGKKRNWHMTWPLLISCSMKSLWVASKCFGGRMDERKFTHTHTHTYVVAFAILRSHTRHKIKKVKRKQGFIAYSYKTMKLIRQNKL